MDHSNRSTRLRELLPEGGGLTSPSRLLVVSASDELRESVRVRLPQERWKLRMAQSGADALEQLIEEGCDVLLLDPALPDLKVSEFCELVRAEWPAVQILPLAAEPSPGGGVSSAGERAVISSVVGEGVGRGGWQGMVGSSEAMQRVYRSVRLVARRDTSVLVQGESGTGKDLVAQAIHAASARAKQPFVVINCAAIPEALLEAELFGYTKGAFTGAVQSRIGRIHAAHGGTLFLDEVGEMPGPLQSKLLRFLEQGEVQRIGGSETLKVDVRVVAATNADLKKMAGAGTFREDLYYRLAVFPIRLPALRERMEDLPELVEMFLGRFAPGVRLTAAGWESLRGHDWPGNVRELRNVMERASLYAEGAAEIDADDVVL